MTWPKVEAHLKRVICAFLLISSTKEHGPKGVIGTFTICAEDVALSAAKEVDAIVAPVIAYTSATRSLWRVRRDARNTFRGRDHAGAAW